MFSSPFMHVSLDRTMTTSGLERDRSLQITQFQDSMIATDFVIISMNDEYSNSLDFFPEVRSTEKIVVSLRKELSDGRLYFRDCVDLLPLPPVWAKLPNNFSRQTSTQGIELRDWLKTISLH
jgi:hypothetical protein